MQFIFLRVRRRKVRTSHESAVTISRNSWSYWPVFLIVPSMHCMAFAGRRQMPCDYRAIYLCICHIVFISQTSCNIVTVGIHVLYCKNKSVYLFICLRKTNWWPNLSKEYLSTNWRSLYQPMIVSVPPIGSWVNILSWLMWWPISETWCKANEYVWRIVCQPRIAISVRPGLTSCSTHNYISKTHWKNPNTADIANLEQLGAVLLLVQHPCQSTSAAFGHRATTKQNYHSCWERN